MRSFLLLFLVAGIGAARTYRAAPGDDLESVLERLGPGDTLLLAGGTYRVRLVAEGLAGRPGAPITIRGVARDEVVFDGGCRKGPFDVADANWTGELALEGFLRFVDCSHLVLADLTVRGSIAFGVEIERGRHIRVENLLVDGTGNGGLIVDADDAVIVGNEIRGTNQGWRDEEGHLFEGDHEALSVIGESARFEVARNHVHDCLEEGIDVKESSHDGAVRANRVERCLVGIYLDEVRRVIVEGNLVIGSGRFLDGSGRARPFSEHPYFGQLAGEWFGTGIQLATGDLGELSRGHLSDVKVHRNVIADCLSNGIEFWDELRESGRGTGAIVDCEVYNNTIVGCRLGGVRLTGVRRSRVVNNVIVDCGEGGVTGDAIGENQVASNLFHRAREAGDSAISGDPLFADAGGLDFRLGRGSPAIDRGVELGLPSRGRPDLGAFEYEGE